MRPSGSRSLITTALKPPFARIAAAQVERGALRHREQHVHRVLADDRRQRAAGRRDDIAFGDRGAADLAVDRRADLGVAEVDLGGLQLRLRAGDLRRKGALRGERGVDGRLLPGGRASTASGPARRVSCGIAVLRLELLDGRLGAVDLRLKRRPVRADRAGRPS